MDRARLAEKGIFIEDDDGGCELLPPHVESLQDALLDFRRTIPDKFGFSEEEILKLLNEDGTNARDDIPGDDNDEISDELEICAGIRELTNHLGESSQIWTDGYGEDDWKMQFEQLFLDNLVKDAQVCGHTRQAARAKFYYDSFQGARDRPWTLFGPDGSERKQGDLPEPKPGWVAHFPVYVISPAEYNHQHSGLQQFASSHSIVDNFSQVTLEHLAGHGLQPSATGVTETGRRGAALSSEYVLFPWLIVEYMKDEYKGNEELCYSHAANAGSAALKMLKNLSRHDLQSLGDIPPVVTITVRRDLVRVWIMHSSSSKDTCEMQVIWRGSLTRMVDILELRAILENCESWATRVLRPWASRQIDLWKQHCPDDCPRPFDASLRRRAMQSRNSSNRPTSEEDALDKDSKKNENKDVDLKQMIREEHDWLLQQLLKDPVETKRPTRSMGTQTGPEDKTHPLEKSAVRPMTLNPKSPFPPRKILDPKPRLTKTTTPSGPSLSSDKGEFAPTSTQQEKHDRQRQVSSVDLFKKKKLAYGANRIVPIKLPDVSSEEILAKKPWLGTMERFGVEKQIEMALTQRIQEKKADVEENEIEKDKAKEQDDGTRNKDNETEGGETKAKSDYSKDDNGSEDKGGEEEESKEKEPASSLKEGTEEVDTGSTLTTDDKGDPPIDIAEAAPIPEGEDTKGDSNPKPLTSSKDYSTNPTEMAENERSSEIAKKENPEETIEIERTETNPKKNSDEIIEKANSEKTMEKDKLGEIIKEWIAEDSPNDENPKETIEKQYFGESVVGESSDRTSRRVRVPLPQLAPEPGTEVPGQLYWRDLFDQRRENDNQMGLDQSAIKQNTPPRDGPAEHPREETPNSSQAVKSKLSPPTETKPSTVFDATQWTHIEFAFGSSAVSPFTFKMEMEGSAEDPRNSSMPRTQRKDGKLFDWPKEDDDDGGPALSENPRPPKQIKGSES